MNTVDNIAVEAMNTEDNIDVEAMNTEDSIAVVARSTVNSIVVEAMNAVSNNKIDCDEQLKRLILIGFSHKLCILLEEAVSKNEKKRTENEETLSNTNINKKLIKTLKKELESIKKMNPIILKTIKDLKLGTNNMRQSQAIELAKIIYDCFPILYLDSDLDTVTKTKGIKEW